MRESRGLQEKENGSLDQVDSDGGEWKEIIIWKY
jgi:hypothetical protein